MRGSRRHAAAVLLAAALGGCFGGGYGTSDVRPGDRSPTLASALGALPGFGAGHRYAGDSRAANTLLVTEAASLLFMLRLAREAGDLHVASDDRLSAGEIALTVFLGSWLYDISHAPSVARRHNQSRRRFDGILTPAGGVSVYRF